MTEAPSQPGESVERQEGLFRDRRDAGQALAERLEDYRDRIDVVVLALPRGGVPVAYEIATGLRAPLDVWPVRKLGAPGLEQLAMCAVAGDGLVVLDDDVVRGLGIPPEVIEAATEAQARELPGWAEGYREGRPMPEVAGLTVVLVDDGLATGVSMRAAIRALRRLRPGRVVVAIPAAPRSTIEELTALVDEVICATSPSPFFAVGESYWDSAQVTDEQVRDLLHASATTVQGAGWSRRRSDAAVIRSEAVPVEEGVPSDTALFDLVGEARFVLIGDASHGTHEFYAARAQMTRRLIEEKGFAAVAAEADWPGAYRANRYVRGRSEDATAEEALCRLERFPAWMWRNTVVLDFVGWLRDHNDRFGPDDPAKAGFYGLDLYSLHRSIQEVIDYLERVDPQAAARARERYSCFDHYGGYDDRSPSGFAAAFGAGQSCEREVVEQLVDLQRHAQDYARGDAPLAEDELFAAEQNARTVKAAAEYYRAMFGSRVAAWNLRDTHLADTLDAVADHLSRRRGEPAKIVVWAHNSHLGDARATEVSSYGQLNVGQLVRERHPGACRIVGFTTYTGAVTAADEWGGPTERKWVRPGLPNSMEELFHDVGEKGFLLPFDGAPRAAEALRTARLERAIGVIYRPESERESHHLRGRAADQFDAVIHVEESRAVEPLERTSRWDEGEAPGTYPFAV